MKSRPLPPPRGAFFLAAVLAAAGALRGAQKNPTSKFYVADISGDVQIDTGTKVDDLTKHSVYNADGSVVETKPNAVNAMVFSNGTGVFFDSDTRLEVKKFEQEPFVPERTDMDVEPSVSQTQAFLPHGTIGLCTSKLVAGSSMNYQTPLGGVNIHGGQVVIQSENNRTVISMLSGESTVNSGDAGDTGGELVKDGEQAVIVGNPNGGPPQVTIQPIPGGDRAKLEGLVTMACSSKKTVYFEARAAKNTNASNTANLSANSTSNITAFDGDDGGPPSPLTGPTTGTAPQVIVAVPVAPSNVPVQFNVSSASLPSGTGG